MTLRCAVIGVGYLGRFHAQKYAALPEAELVAVVDADAARAGEIAAETACTAVTDYRELLGQVDAVSIVAPTTLHHEIASAFLQQGVHVLVEKPITVTLEEADDLIRLAEENGCVLQVGHLERFNAAIQALEGELDSSPLFIESHRLAPFKPRATDVDVVLDLMIHDIDIILDLVKSDLKNISATGASVLSDSIDIANARLEFDNGCVANVTASRVSQKSERKMRLFLPHAYIGVDFQEKSVDLYRKGDGEMFPGVPEIRHQSLPCEEQDALEAEIRSFLDTIKNGGTPLVSGGDGRRALATALEINQLVPSRLGK